MMEVRSVTIAFPTESDPENTDRIKFILRTRIREREREKKSRSGVECDGHLLLNDTKKLTFGFLFFFDHHFERFDGFVIMKGENGFGQELLEVGPK